MLLTNYILKSAAFHSVARVHCHGRKNKSGEITFQHQKVKKVAIALVFTVNFTFCWDNSSYFTAVISYRKTYGWLDMSVEVHIVCVCRALANPDSPPFQLINERESLSLFKLSIHLRCLSSLSTRSSKLTNGSTTDPAASRCIFSNIFSYAWSGMYRLFFALRPCRNANRPSRNSFILTSSNILANCVDK